MKEEKFLEKIEKDYPTIEIKRYEAWYNQDNQKLFQEFVQKYKVGQLGVPLTIIKDKYFLGYQSDETTGRMIEDYLQTIISTEKKEVKDKIEKIRLPIFGEVDLSKMTSPVLTITLGALDGLNPCAMWILLFLIAILINLLLEK